MNRNPANMSYDELKVVLHNEDHYRHAEILSNDVAWRANASGALIYVSKRWEEIMGYTIEETLSGIPGLEHSDDYERIAREWKYSVETGTPFDITARFNAAGNDNIKWLRIQANPRRDHDGSILQWYGVTDDITETIMLIERQSTLLQELNHRVKNSLATVQSIVMQTFRSLRERDGYNIEAYKTFCDKVMERLLLLSNAHDLLTKNSWSGTDLGSLIEHTLDAIMSNNRYETSGPPVGLNPNAALLLAMVFHELGTNAIKYGSWGVEGGVVIIGWSIVDGMVELVWRERGGPEITAPDHVGFGTKLITKTGLKELRGTTEMKFDPEGLTCYLRFAISEKVRAG